MIRGDLVESTWSAPAAVVSPAELEQALTTAVRELGYRGGEVAIVFDNRNIIYHLQEVPPGSPGLVLRLVERLVRQQPFFDEPAVWVHSAVPGVRGKSRWLLSLAPESFVRGIQEACDAAGMRLRGLFSPAAILEREFAQVPGAGDETLLLAADAGGQLYLQSGRRDGSLMFSRSVAMAGAPDGARVVQEINRTLLFTQQQFSVTINQCWLLGPGLRAAIGNTPVREGLTLEECPARPDEFYYAVGAARLQPSAGANFARRLPRGSGVSPRGLALAAGLALVMAVGFVALVERGVRVAARERAQREQAQAATGEILRQAQAQLQTIALEKRLIDAAEPTNHPAIAPHFLTWLSLTTPDNFTLQAVNLVRTNEHWAVRIEGTGDASLSGLLPALERFEGALTNGVFRMQVTDSTSRRLLAGGQGLSPSEPGYFLEGFIP